VRISPVFRSINKPMTHMGVERDFFYYVVLGVPAFIFLMWKDWWGIAASGIAFGFFLNVGRWLTAKGPSYLKIMQRASRLKKSYDPIK